VRPSAEVEKASKCFALFEGDRAGVGTVIGNSKRPATPGQSPTLQAVVIPSQAAFRRIGISYLTAMQDPQKATVGFGVLATEQSNKIVKARVSQRRCGGSHGPKDRGGVAQATLSGPLGVRSATVRFAASAADPFFWIPREGVAKTLWWIARTKGPRRRSSSYVERAFGSTVRHSALCGVRSY